MIELHRMKRLPGNFAELVEEMSDGISGLYGPRAAHAYREIAAPALEAAIEHPLTEAIAAVDGSATAGFLLAFLRHGVGQISFIHVLHRYAGRGVEQRLVTECIGALRTTGVDGIVSECIPFCALDLDALYRSQGFEHVPRALMSAPLHAPELHAEEDTHSRPVDEADYHEVARIIVEAYLDHPGRVLHAEVCCEDAALEFVQRVADGEYGIFRPAYIRAVERDGSRAGVILGCQAAPDQGFVLQVAVRPSYQNQGIGNRLFRELASAFRHAGLSQMALGVTRASPATRLYQRLAFQTLRNIDAYVWSRYDLD